MNNDIVDTAKALSAVAAQTALAYFRQPLDIELKEDASPVTKEHVMRPIRNYLTAAGIPVEMTSSNTRELIQACL